MRYFLRFVLVFIFLISISSFSWAQETKETKSRCLESVTFLSGWGLAKLHEKGDYHIVPLFVDFNFNLKQATKKFGLNPPGILQIALEPFVSYVYDPDDNIEAGANLVLKIGLFPDNWKFQPYIAGSFGGMYMSQHTRELATQLNFNEHGGGGFHYYMKDNLAFTFDYRYRHISNGGVKHPNHGINTSIFLGGITYKF